MSLYSMEFDAVTSFLGEEPSLWAAERDDLFKVQGTEHGSSTSLADELLGEIGGQCVKESSHFEDLPEWMSEKIALTEWIDAADIMPPDLLTTVPLSLSKEEPVEPAEELLQLLMVDERIPPQPPSPGEEKAPDLLALYPAEPLSSPDSPLSQASEGSLMLMNSEGSSYPSSPNDTTPKSPEAPLTTEERLWQIADGLTTIFSNDILNDTMTDLESQPVFEARSPSPLSVIEEDPKLLEAAIPQKKSRAKPKLKTVGDPGIKKTKKRDQNKVAATRYREKKRAEANVLLSEQMELEEKNAKLNDKVESLEREIRYLKDLMVEVHKVKGELKILRK